MKSIFPTSIDGDLLKLVHLSNGFRMLDGAKPLQVGDVCNAEARIASVTNTDAGKIVKVKGHIYRAGQPVIEVVSAFLYRGRFTDYENTFETTEEPDYLVDLPDDAAVGVLKSKEWFEWDDESMPLNAGTALVFRVQSQVTFKDKTSYRDVSVSGDIFVRDQLKRFVKVGSVDFQQDDCQGNPVVAYVQRHGTPQGRLTPLANDGYTLTTTEGSTDFSSPLTNEPYSKISGDFNPIHINPYFSDYASLPGTITHGMWSSAATRKYVETVVAQGHPDRVLA
jgi:fatty acid synthase subunit alpha, fungi type